MPNIAALIVVATVMFCVLGGVTLLAHIYNLNNIKSKTVGDGQHGTARVFYQSGDTPDLQADSVYTGRMEKEGQEEHTSRSAAGNYRRLPEQGRQYYRLCG